MDDMAKDENNGQPSHAARAGQVPVFPNGLSRLRGGMLATWHAGACRSGARMQLCVTERGGFAGALGQ